MRTFILQIVLMLSFGVTYSQNNCDYYQDDYVPKNLDDALAYLDCKWSDKDKEDFKNKSEKDAVAELHFGTGQAIRNNWGLWEKRKNSIKRYFNRHGIYHPDDISSIILTSFHRKLNNKPIDLDKQIESYKIYWEKAKTAQDSIKNKRNQFCENEFNSFQIGDTVKIEHKVNVQGKNVWVYRIQKHPDLNESPDCYVTGIVKNKQKKTRKKGNYTLTILIMDICGHKEAIYGRLENGLKVGEKYDFFSLEHFKISKN